MSGSAPELSQPATLFLGLDTELRSIRPEPKYFERLEDAVRYAIETLSSDERHGAYIRLAKDHRTLRRAEIEALYKTL